MVRTNIDNTVCNIYCAGRVQLIQYIFHIIEIECKIQGEYLYSSDIIQQRPREKMGNSVGKVFEKIVGTKEIKILMVRLDAAGKTMILYNLKLSEVVTTIIPPNRFIVETAEYKNISFTVCDVGGQDNIRIHTILYL